MRQLTLSLQSCSRDKEERGWHEMGFENERGGGEKGESVS